jgi:hypothetical protein
MIGLLVFLVGVLLVLMLINLVYTMRAAEKATDASETSTHLLLALGRAEPEVDNVSRRRHL